MGAFTSFFASAFRHQPQSPEASPRKDSLVQIGFSEQQPPSTNTPNSYELEYAQELVLRNADSTRLFRRTLTGIAVDSSDTIYVLGDGEVRIFEPGGNSIRSWKAPEGALCLTVGTEDRVYFGLAGRIEIYSGTGVRVGGFSAGDSGQPARITSIKIYKQEILVADASARYIRRYDTNGRQLGVIGIHGKTKGFMLPNRLLDIDVDAEGVVRSADPGRHRVSSWSLDGLPVGHFGKFGQRNLEDFVGCCNPVNLALARDGNVVTAEKVAARIKVYNPQGKLLAIIGSEHFDAKCTQLPLAADSKRRIIVADPVRLEVKIFSIVGEA